MEYLLLQLWELLINGIEAFLYYALISKKMIPKEMPYRKNKIYLFLGCQIALLYLFNHMQISTLITIAFFDVVRFLFTFCFFYTPLFTCIFWIILYTLLCMLADMMTILLPTVLANVNVETILLGGRFRLPITLTYICLVTLFIYFVIIFTDKKLFFSLFQKIIFFCLSLASMTIAQYIFAVTLEATANPHTKKIANSLGIICFLFIILFLALLIFVYQLGIARQKNITYLEEKKQMELEQAQFQNILETTRELRTMKHDMNLYLDTIETLTLAHKEDELLEYIAGYRKHLENVHHLLTTGNTAIDCIVSAKLSAAKAQNINVNYSILLPAKMPLDDVSICSLIGNMFNNAIEACEKITEYDTTHKECSEQSTPKRNTFSGEKQIQFTIQPYQKMLGIHMKNSSNGKYLFDSSGNLISSKEKHSSKLPISHGLGLKRIREIVATANGILELEPKENEFELHIMLPLLEDSNHNTSKGENYDISH